MAKQPQLIRNDDGKLRINASFPNGRYTFSLRPGAEQLLTRLGYGPGDVLSWYLFETLAIVGDVWLPNTAGGFVDDLAVPDSRTAMDEEEAVAVADYLEGRRIGTEDRERLAEVITSSALCDHLSIDDFDSKEAWVAETNSMLSETEDGGRTERGRSTGAEQPSVSLLHVGQTTLGRENMGRAARKADYLDAFAQAIDIAVDRRVDAVVQTGRLFQSRTPDRETVSGLQTQLKKLQDEGIPFYLVCGPKELELPSTVLDSLAASGLLNRIGGETVKLADGIVLAGVDAGSDSVGDGESHAGISEDETLLVACGNTDVAGSTGTTIPTITQQSPTRPLAFLAGKRTDPVRETRSETHLIDPGSVEHVLSKSTIDREPPACGVNEYFISDGTLRMTRHELDVRPFRTFEFEVTESTTLESLRSKIDRHDLQNDAVLAVLNGSTGGAEQPSRKAVQSLIADRAFCARVYDDRSLQDDGEQSDREAQPDDETLEAVLGDLVETVTRLESTQSVDVSTMETTLLADSYAVLSKAKSQLDELRKATRDELTSRIEPNETVAGELGTVAGTKSRRRSLRDAETVAAVLREHDVPIEHVTSETIDSGKVEELLEKRDVAITEEELFEITESEYIRRQDVELADDTEPEETGTQRDPDQGDSSGVHKVYLGDGAGIGGWTPVEKSAVEDEIVPIVAEHSRPSDGDGTITVNFSSDVSISGWNYVDADVVRERVIPLVEQHRVP